MNLTEKRRLVLVDDSEINLRLLAKILQNDYELLTASNGQEAMELLRQAGDSISAVVLDLVMPVLDGYEVLRQMRADRELAHIPVIVATGEDSGNVTDTEVLALSLGAQDFVTKPYHPDIIRHRIANTIDLRETAAFVNTVQHDEMTGLYSKPYFYLQVERTLRNNPNQKYDMICCDIDRFKVVNDLYGTQVGDTLLKRCALVLLNTVGKQGVVGRIGPDLFACLIGHRTTYSNRFFADAIDGINDADIPLDITLRFGVYMIEDSHIPVSLMCDRANIAESAIKGLYGVYFRVYDESIRHKLVEEQSITANMSKALREQQFEVYFQPKYNLKSERIVGAEALVRWNHPEKGLMPPGLFIPLFEKNGFITMLDQYVWEVSCQKIRAWMDLGHTAVPVSVNVSRADIYNPHLDDILLSLIQKYRISPKYLYLEITESAYTENSQQLIETVTKLKRLGFYIEMDDFGTGYSSLNMLADLPIDVVKLDVGFLQHHQQYSHRSVLSFIISLTKWMGLGVIAEGVETKEQADALRSYGCACAQGYYYARPMPQKQFEELLLKQRDELEQEELLHAETAAVEGEEANPSILIVDAAGSDFACFSAMLSDLYTVLRVGEVTAAVEMVESGKSNLRAVICSLEESVTPQQLIRLVDGCKDIHIPVITLHDSFDRLEASIGCGVSDYITRPYNQVAIRNRIRNAIGNEQMTLFEMEKEINTAIAEMKKRAMQDSLTGLLNRTEFENRVQASFGFGQCRTDGVFIMLDVDNFKNLNDTCGHIVGDQALQMIASTLYELFPETDTVGRMGGDEFALFVPYALNRKELELKVRKLCHALEFQEKAIRISCSAGIAIAPEFGQDFQTLYENADVALLLAKRSGKSRCVFYQKGMEKPEDMRFAQQAAALLDQTTDALFVSDAVTSEILFINETACHLIDKKRKDCLGARCYQLFWDRCRNCDRCEAIGACKDHFYEEDAIVMKDGVTRIHIKAKMERWDGRSVKVHYLHVESDIPTAKTGALAQG